jgi:N-acetylneuraminic acid mutarotase
MTKDRMPSGWLFWYLLVIAVGALPLGAQTTAPDEWTWMGGNSTIREPGGYGWPGVYGSIGIAVSGNIPGGRSGAVSWTDRSGHFWLFGGQGYDASGNSNYLYLNDLWEFDPSANEWMWVSGYSLGPAPGVYGTLGTPAAENAPAARASAARWIDTSGNLWLFGGGGDNPNNLYGAFNDLWKFDVSTKEWTWMSGCNGAVLNNCENYGVYGTLGTPSPVNVPGVRVGAASWTDRDGNLWLFGGWGMPITNSIESYFGFFWGALNDLWKFDPSTKQWTWMGGSYKSDQSGVYGTLGTADAANIPSSRSNATVWVDGAGNIWLFGGDGYTGLFNDLWELNSSTQEWTWRSGSNQTGATGVYGMLGIPSATNIPGNRVNAAAWIDHSNRLWLFGGGYADAGQTSHAFNDLWMFDPSTNQWSWMGGSNSDPGYDLGWPGVYGVLGTPGPETTPGGRGSVASWSDTAGNFWLFGGAGLIGPYGNEESMLNDLWEYQPGTAPAKMTPTVTVTPSASSIDASDYLTVNISVNSGPGGPTPTGSVRLTAYTFASKYTALTGGTASITVPFGLFNPGTVTLSVIYSGDGSYNGANGTANITVVSAANFKLSCSPAAVTITRGATTGNTSVVTISPSGGYIGSVALDALLTTPAGVQRLPSMAFVGSPVNITGPNAGTATLVISTTAPTAAALHDPGRRKSPGYAAGGATLACILLVGLSKRRRRWQAVLGTLALFFALSLGVLACGGGGASNGGGTGGFSDPGTSPGYYLITVTGTSTKGTTQSSATVGVTVQ